MEHLLRQCVRRILCSLTERLLKKIGGNVQFNCFPVRELYKLEEIGGNITIKPDSLGMSKLLKAVFEINDDRICNRIVLLDKPVNLNK